MKHLRHFFLPLLLCGVALGLGLPATAQHNEWTWMKGSQSFAVPGTYGTQGVEAAANTPGARRGSVSWKGTGNTLWLMGGLGFDAGGNYGDQNDLWKYNTVTSNWTWMKGSSTGNQPGTYGTQGTEAAANTPGAREGSVTWTDAGGNLWLFGGTGRDATSQFGSLNDLWKYDVATGNWTWIKGSNTKDQPSVYGTLGTPDNANTPGSRDGAAAWMDANGTFWLFGGLGRNAAGNTANLNDLWAYVPTTNQWVWVKGSSTGGEASVYGTQGTPDAANTPGGRDHCAAWTDASGNLWLFGGFGLGGRLNDLWKYDAATGNWTWMKGNNTGNQSGIYGTQGTTAAANTPGGRSRPSFWQDTSGNFWLYGGSGYDGGTSQGNLNDVWKYDVTTGNWTWMKGANTAGVGRTYGTLGVSDAANTTGGRSEGLTWVDAGGNVWLFGGSINNNPLNDLWKYKYCPTFSMAAPATQPLTLTKTLAPVNNTTTFDDNCAAIATLLPTGGSPVSGSVTAKLWVNNTVLTPGATLIRRHSEITPATNATTATARVTLYIPQADFNSYNDTLAPNTGTSMPSGPNDFSGIANVRIYKYSGTSSDGSGSPNTYNSGDPIIIDPSDNDIIWNTSGSYWEISFPVNGFSGFFVGGSNAVILPVKLTAFTAAKQGSTALLTWKVAQEDNISTYTIERSADGRSFTATGSVASLGNTTAARSYSFTDADVLKGANYYRLKTTEKDGKVSYSDVRLLNFGSTITIALYPNPAKDKATLTGVEAGMSICLLDAVGKVLQVQQATGTTEILLLNGFAKGLYSVQVYSTDGQLLSTARLVKE